MKNFTTTYLTILCIMLASLSYAQMPPAIPGIEEADIKYKPIRLNRDVHQKAPKISSGWFNFFADLRDAWLLPTEYYRTSLFPDSTVLVQNGSNFTHAFKFSFGQVLDPTSQFHVTPIKEAAKYSVDSIGLPYRYFRLQTGAPDTLVISMFHEDQLLVVPNPSWSPPRSYATCDYDTILLKGKDPYREITFLLADEHEQSASDGVLYIPVNEDIPAGEIVAFTFTYFPGNPWNPGDTLANLITTAGPNTRNCFNTYDGKDLDATLDNDFYNMNLWAPTYIRYNIHSLANGWEGLYIPGAAIANVDNGVRHMDVNFKLTYEDFTGINEIGREYNFAVYPNPFKEAINFQYALKASDQARIEVIDAVGKQVKLVELNVTEKKASVDMGDLPYGFYFAKLVVNNTIVTSAKIVRE